MFPVFLVIMSQSVSTHPSKFVSLCYTTHLRKLIVSYGHCEQYRTGMAPLCDQVLKDGMYVFIPTVRISLENIVKNVENLFLVVDAIMSSNNGSKCFDAGHLIYCYWYFIPCGSGTTPGLPRPLCLDECLAIAEKCVSEAEASVGLFVDTPTGFESPDCCNLTSLTGPLHNCCQPLGIFNSELTLVYV